ncbi:MAG TPA: sugar transferase, partial [Arenibaculum sp.]|nr:sugar transferase [Arenibaculum sp.]
MRLDPVEAFRRRILAIGMTLAIGTLVLLSVIEQDRDRMLLEMAATFVLVFALLPYTPFALNRFLAPVEREPASLAVGSDDARNWTMCMLGAFPEAWHTLDEPSEAAWRHGVPKTPDASGNGSAWWSPPPEGRVVIGAPAGQPDHRVEAAGLCGLVALRLRPACRSQTHVLLKWILDKTLGTIALVFFLPLIVICVIAIKLADPGPAFYSQIRVGRDGRPIRVWKLRTMYADAEQRLEEHLASDPDAARQWDLYCKLHDDPRIIPVVGPLLRKTSMDEVPQLFCVLNGSMSMVG